MFYRKKINDFIYKDVHSSPVQQKGEAGGKTNNFPFSKFDR